MDLFYIEQQHSKSISEATGLPIDLLSGLQIAAQHAAADSIHCNVQLGGGNCCIMAIGRRGNEITLRGLTKMMK